mmetsp:Transcript_21167/g.42003  ORF Transcript_21167/g.42003 Transcript_21167/m.42003 type:complete len:202 (+) Transcript_21167:34-639(+)|eukprot:CAMPEP_0175139730 /NCGR_PEP_ID=MMETSP0087-20121206/11075_1 /TAXON_ID=136419 /ORGANISM="Unknown Unknown, Strain D1" /LENGTH=201 /DNA_ID=CAMNT_0016422793 /DNA_START=31 /DNA_END=636 /DNA_ORIENTATION=+
MEAGQGPQLPERQTGGDTDPPSLVCQGLKDPKEKSQEGVLTKGQRDEPEPDSNVSLEGDDRSREPDDDGSGDCDDEGDDADRTDSSCGSESSCGGGAKVGILSKSCADNRSQSHTMQTRARVTLQPLHTLGNCNITLRSPSSSKKRPLNSNPCIEITPFADEHSANKTPKSSASGRVQIFVRQVDSLPCRPKVQTATYVFA